MTTPSLSAPVLVARSRAVVTSSPQSLALPVLFIGLSLCLLGYVVLGWWLLQSLMGLFA